MNKKNMILIISAMIIIGGACMKILLNSNFFSLFITIGAIGFIASLIIMIKDFYAR